MVISGDGHSVCSRGHASFHKTCELAVVLSALLLVTVLLSSSFLPFTGSSSKGENGDLAERELQSNTREPAISNLHSQKQSWDWSEFVDDQGYVDVIVSWSDQSPKTPYSSSDNGGANDMMKKLSSGMKVRFSKAYSGFLSRVPLDVLEDFAQKNDQAIRIYPDLKVNATVSDNMLEVGADQVWARNDPSGRPVTGLGIVVAIIDTGVDYNHPDLGGGYGPAYKVVGGYDFYNDDADPMDDNGHGTHVAGIIAGKGGMSGVAPDATILAYKVLGPDGSGRMSDVIVAIDRAMDPNDDGDTSDHADVVSMSLGGKGQSDDPVCEAVENAVDAGIVVVVAAGNDGPSMGTVSSPGLAPDAITVGAVDNDGVLASFSSRGTSPDLSIKPEISAPGVTITSTVPYANAAHSSPTGYAAMSGTSMATPHVSGGAALLLQMHPTWTPQQVKSAIVSGAAKLDESIWCAGAGGLWLPSAIDSRVFFNPSIVSYGLVGSDPSDVSISNSDSSVTLGLSSNDYCGLSADGEGSLAVWTNISSVSPGSVSVQPGGSVPFTLSVSSLSTGNPEGYYDGEVRFSGGSVQTRLPFGFAVLSRLNVHVMDASGREVFDPYGGVWVYSDPSAAVAVGIHGSVDKPAPPASFLLPSGDYSAHSMGHQLLYDFSNPYVLSAKFSLDKLETRDVYLNMSGARIFTIDLKTDEGLPIFVKDYRVYGRHVGESNISFHLVGSDYSIKGSEMFSLPTSKTIYISDTDLTIGISISGFSYTSAMWDFMSRNWQHWYEYAGSDSNVFYVESSTDLQYLLAWEFEGIDSETPTALALVPGQYSVYDTKYDIPGQLVDIWGDWGKHRSIGGDSVFYIRRDTDTSLNSFFSGMTRRTIVQGVFTEVYFPGDLFQGFIEREFYSPDYSSLVRANLASEVYLPDRNFLTPLEGISTVQRIGSGPFYPALRTENTADSLVMYQPILRDQSGSKVGGMALPSMNLYRNGQLLGVYQIAEHLARPDAMRIVSLSDPGTYTASVDYSPVPQICGEVNLKLGFTVPATDMDPPQIAALSMSQRFVPGHGIPITVDARDDKSTPTVNISWRPGSATSWTALPVSSLGGSNFGATIQTTNATSTVDVMVTVTDASGNYLQYIATNASARQIPVLFDIAASAVEVSYMNGDVFVVLTGRLSDSLGNPLHPSAGVPIEMITNGRKIGMLLDEYMETGSHTHNGTIRFEWHLNPTKIFSGPNETINVDVAFDLGTYEPVHKTITLSSKYYSNPAPVITLVSPANGSLIPAGQLIDIDVFDDSAVQVQMRLDGLASVQLLSPWDVDTARWTEGDHWLEITATDDQLVTSSEQFTFHIDRTNPVVKILSPTPGSAVPRGWTITAEVSDDNLDQVTYALDNGVPQTLAIPYTIDMTGWLVGSHSVVIEATDLVGHHSSDSTQFEIVDRTLVLNLVSPTNGDVVHSGVQITFSVLSLEICTNRWAEYGTWHPLGASTSISTSGWTEGPHVITINSTNAFDGWDEMEVSLTIDDTDPIISLKSPAPQSFVSPSDRLSISIIDDNFKSVTWNLWGQTRTSSSSEVSISLANSPKDGYFTVSVSALDKAGNEENSSFVFAMDSTAPTLEVQGLKDGDAVRSGQVLIVVPQDVFLSNVWWSIDSGIDSILPAPYTINTSTFSAGLHSLRLVAADFSGKSCACNMSLYIDTAPPIIVPAFPTSVYAGSSFDLSANITDDFKVGRADLYYELKEGGFGCVAMYDTGSAYNVQIASTISTWNGMIVYIRACDSVGNWAESEHVELVVISSSSGDGVPPASGGNPNSGLGQFSFVSWFMTVEGMIFAGILIGMLVLVVAIYRRRRRSSEDARLVHNHARPKPREIPEASVRRSSPKIDITPSAAAARARPVLVNSKPIPAAVVKKTPGVAWHAQARVAPSLLDAIPSMPIKAVAREEETKDDEDYGALIERELIIPGLSHSVFSDEVRDLTRELARCVDLEFQTKGRPESPRNSPVH